MPVQAESFLVNLIATVSRVRFARDGYVILAINPKDKKIAVAAKGHVAGNPEDLVGQTLSFEGAIEPNSKYGDSIVFHQYEVQEGEDYFWVHVARLQERSRRVLYSIWGKDPSWLDDEDKAKVKRNLMDIPGIKGKTSSRILERWEEYRSIKRLMDVVSSFGIPQSQAVMIYRHFGDEASRVVLEKPYRLTEVRGIGFKKADDIARKIGISERDPLRFVAAMLFAVNESEQHGSTCIEENDLLAKLNEMIVMSDGSIAVESVEAIGDLVALCANTPTIKNPVVYIDDAMLSLQSSLSMDRYILRTIESAKDSSAMNMDQQEAMQIVASRADCQKLGDEQKQGVIAALSGGSITIISGYAGTGKTTTSRVILNILQEQFELEQDDIVGCALSGVAANRIKTQSGYSAFTIHSLLGTSDEGGWLHNADNPLEQSVIILDEASMVDTYLMFSLMKAIDFSRTKLIMLGDPGQLPPVGSGQPFIDMIELGLVPACKLTRLYRQSEDQAIAYVASQVRQGMRPGIEKHYKDVISVRAHGKETGEVNKSIEQNILDLAKRHKYPYVPDVQNDKTITDYLFSFQVITPRKSGPVGQESLNSMLRSVQLPVLNADTACQDIMPVSVFEKLIHLKNMDMETTGGRKVRVFNGQVGMVVAVDRDESKFTVRYPLEGYSVTYSEKDVRAGSIGYAWALTIHKTQGSEYGVVVIPFTNSHWMMLNAKLTYTAITRAKQLCALVGDVRAFTRACVTLDEVKRSTVLQRLVRSSLA